MPNVLEGARKHISDLKINECETDGFMMLCHLIILHLLFSNTKHTYATEQMKHSALLSGRVFHSAVRNVTIFSIPKVPVEVIFQVR